jgi:DNA-binding Lrp family transcriptional regulator
VQRLLDDRVLTRFGPMFNAENLGGALSLCAMQVPLEHYDEVAALVNAFPEVAHNYERDHLLNMWFVIATERPEQAGAVIREIEQATECQVYDMPKQEEFYIGLKLAV